MAERETHWKVFQLCGDSSLVEGVSHGLVPNPHGTLPTKSSPQPPQSPNIHSYIQPFSLSSTKMQDFQAFLDDSYRLHITTPRFHENQFQALLRNISKSKKVFSFSISLCLQPSTCNKRRGGAAKICTNRGRQKWQKWGSEGFCGFFSRLSVQ